MSKEDYFFTQTECERCGTKLKIRTMSWFNNDTICNDCANKEKLLRERLPNNGRDYEGCGYIPQ